MTQLLTCDPLVQDYRTFFVLFDWSCVDASETAPGGRGRTARMSSAYLKAFLLRLQQGLRYATEVRRFLLQHPLLVIELGFRLVLDPDQPYGFDVAYTVPCAYWLREQLHRFDPTLLQHLLHATAQALQQEILVSRKANSSQQMEYKEAS